MQKTAHRHVPLRTEGFAHPKRNVASLGIREGMRVADFGAGSGAYTLGIAERLGGSGHVYAIDVQRELLRRIHNEATRRSMKNVEIIWADLEVPRASKLANQSIDLVLISNLLFQVPEKKPVLVEARRIVKPTGNVAIIDWSDSFGSGEAAREGVGKREFPVEEGSERSERRKTVGFRGGLGPRREDVVSKEMAIELTRACGLELVREFSAGAHHYGLLLKPVPLSTV